MDVKVVLGQLPFTLRKKWQRDHEGRGPQNVIFKGPINALTWSNGFCGERGKRGGLVGEGKGPWQINAIFNKKRVFIYFLCALIIS